MTKNKSSKPVTNQRASAQVKARLLFGREVIIDEKNDPKLIDEQVLTNLVARKAEAGKTRDQMIRTSVLLLLAGYAIAYSFRISIPAVDINLAQKDYVVALLVCVSALALMQAFIFVDTEGTYDGLIDAIIIQKSHSGHIDPDVLKSAHQTQLMLFKTLRKRFNLYSTDSIQTGWAGTTAYWILSKMVSLIYSTAFLSIYAAIVWISVQCFPKNYIGYGMAAFCWIVLLTSLMVQHIPHKDFAVTDLWLEDAATEDVELSDQLKTD